MKKSKDFVRTPPNSKVEEQFGTDTVRQTIYS
jgi:hypothetical protein